MGVVVTGSRFKVQGMAKTDKFEDLIIWQKARQLSIGIYPITKRGEYKYDTRFVQQIRAAAGSIMDNIAEGFEREGNKEFVNFLYIAKGAAGEVRSQLTRAFDCGYLSDIEYSKLYNDCIDLSRSISKFITSIKNSDFRGAKYSEP